MRHLDRQYSLTSTPRLVIHAGFPNCGGESIERTLLQNFSELRRSGVYLFDKNLRIAQQSAALGKPPWNIEDARENAACLTRKLAEQIADNAGHDRQCIAILSAGNLAGPQLAELFTGLDRELEVWLAFYVRPQSEWIISQWMHRDLKKGTSLNQFVDECLDAGRPAFRKDIESWQEALPRARLGVRFLIPELLSGVDPARDFLRLLGLPADEYQIPNDNWDSALDVSILHALSKNPQLFSGPDDNRLTRSLRAVLPKKFQSTNIRLLSAAHEKRIEEFFREENLWLLKTFGTGMDVDQIYRRHFMMQEAELRYSDMQEIDLIYRCLGIILATAAGSSDS